MREGATRESFSASGSSDSAEHWRRWAWNAVTAGVSRHWRKCTNAAKLAPSRIVAKSTRPTMPSPSWSNRSRISSRIASRDWPNTRGMNTDMSCMARRRQVPFGISSYSSSLWGGAMASAHVFTEWGWCLLAVVIVVGWLLGCSDDIVFQTLT